MNELTNNCHKIRLSVVIVAYYSRTHMVDCIRSVLKYNDLDDDALEVIVVENSPADEAEAMGLLLHENFGQSIRLLINEGNRGYGSGNNMGIKNSSGSIVAVMNPDIRITGPLFAYVETFFRNNQRAATIGFKQKGNRDISFYLNPELYFPILRSIVEVLFNRFNFYLQPYFYLSGAFMFFDKSKFVAAGGYDEATFLYYEEPDLIHRFRRLGFSSHFCARYSYRHLIDDRIGFSAGSFRILLSSLRHYLKKFGFAEGPVIARMRMEYKLKRTIARLLGRTELFNLMTETLAIVDESRN